MKAARAAPSPSRGSLRWAILRQALKVSPPSSNSTDRSIERCTKEISRKASGGFKLIPCYVLSEDVEEKLQLLDRKFQAGPNEIFVCFQLPVEGDSKLILIQRLEDHIGLGDFKISNSHDVDTTGLVCCWPSEDVLAYYCINHCEIFRSKRVLELGSGCGLAGLAIATCTDASEVIISDGNPEVIN
ncbi:hypothetical protein AXF42_Ash015278 [Apostasia shenzhenica]|uniref:Calmodulin-lysine N-methyltransferase n=1 Tax=Apostasia shenzhenica TaxID=1088818 RepID=A0A2I0ALY4_9ASPA|nr:hypothetical protein AXF42_Ash015278 [Apostasia shenzhenica]